MPSSIKLHQHFMCFLECILVMCFLSKTLTEVAFTCKFDYQTPKIWDCYHLLSSINISCHSKNTLWCVSSNDLVQYIIFQKPWIWMVLYGIKVKEGGIIICKVNKQLHLTHLWNYHHLMCFLECTLVMCFFKLSCSEHDFHKPCIWMIDSSYELLCMVF